MATLRDISAETGFSIATVSDVLNGNHRGVRRDAKERARQIIEAAKRLGYQPNMVARAMRTRRTWQIGLIVGETLNPTTGDKVQMFGQILRKHRYKLMLGLTGGGHKEQDAYLREFASGLVDGIINLDGTISVEHWQNTVNSDLPFINFGRDDQTNPSRFDYELGMRLAVRHLHALGHQTIGLILGEKQDTSTSKRCHGFIDEMSQLGLESKYIANGDWTFQSAVGCTPQLINAGCTAIVAANDQMAMGAMESVRSLGLSVPEDVSVVGYDDSVLASQIYPKLTTVHIPFEPMIELAVDDMISRVDTGEALASQLFTPQLTVRNSTSRPR